MASAKLRILQTTDFHMQLAGYDYLQDREDPSHGLLRLAPLIADLRRGAVPTILCDGGDFLQGTPLADVLAKAQSGERVHPMIATMNDLAYDVVTLGNHDFDYGIAPLMAALDDLDAPVVSANLRTGPATLLTQPWVILEKDLPCGNGETRTCRIGVIGFVTPQFVDWNDQHLRGRLFTDDIITAANTHVPALRRAGADIIVALCHSGIGSATHTDRMENAALPLARIKGIDVVLAGHTHDLFPSPMFAGLPGINVEKGTLWHKPALMAGSEGSHLGVLDLELLHDDAIGWSIVSHDARLMRAFENAPGDHDATQKKILARLAEPHRATRSALKAHVSNTSERLTSYFTMIGIDPTLALGAAAGRAAIAAQLANTSYAQLPLIATASSFRAGARGGPGNFIDIPAGPIVQRDVVAMSPFNNPVCAVLRRGWQLRNWLEFTAAFFLQLRADQPDQSLIDPLFPAYQFDWLFGLQYTFDIAVPARFNAAGEVLAPSASRITHLAYNGQPVLDDDLFVVATSIYRARGGGGLSAFSADDILLMTQQGAQCVLHAYLTQHGADAATQAPVWHLQAPPGTKATFETAPQAETMLPHEGVLPLGAVEGGFHQFQLTF